MDPVNTKSSGASDGLLGLIFKSSGISVSQETIKSIDMYFKIFFILIV